MLADLPRKVKGTTEKNVFTMKDTDLIKKDDYHPIYRLKMFFLQHYGK